MNLETKENLRNNSKWSHIFTGITCSVIAKASFLFCLYFFSSVCLFLSPGIFPHSLFLILFASTFFLFSSIALLSITLNHAWMNWKEEEGESRRRKETILQQLQGFWLSSETHPFFSKTLSYFHRSFQNG